MHQEKPSLDKERKNKLGKIGFLLVQNPEKKG
jgi:hypothetical protein